jgi:hypothetical protein
MLPVRSALPRILNCSSQKTYHAPSKLACLPLRELSDFSVREYSHVLTHLDPAQSFFTHPTHRLLCNHLPGTRLFPCEHRHYNGPSELARSFSRAGWIGPNVRTHAVSFLLGLDGGSHLRLARGARRHCYGRHSQPPNPGLSFPPANPPIAWQSFPRDAPFSQVTMARRNVRRSVRTKSRMDQVCGAKQ